MKLDIVCIVWGQSYTHLMLEYGFPSLMAAGNLPDWAYCAGTILQLYTSAADALVIRHHRSYQALNQLIEVQLHTTLPETKAPVQTEPFNRLNQGHYQGILNARQREAAFMYMAPDHVFALNCFTTLQTFIHSGAELIMALTPRVDIACQNELHPLRQGEVLTLTPNHAADLFMQYVAPMAQAQFWDADVFNVWCSHVYRYTTVAQVTAQGFHLHPLLMRHPPPFEPQLHSTLDGDYLDYYHSRRENIRIAQGHELFILSLTAAENMALANTQLVGNFTLNQRQLLLDRFYRTFTKPIHRWFFKHRFILTGSKPQYLPNDRCNQAIEAMQAFWCLEAAWDKKHHEHVIRLFNQNEALWSHLPDILQQGGQQYYQMALSAT